MERISIEFAYMLIVGLLGIIGWMLQKQFGLLHQTIDSMGDDLLKQIANLNAKLDDFVPREPHDIEHRHLTENLVDLKLRVKALEEYRDRYKITITE